MADIEELKRLNRIEDVIQELGMPLDLRTRGKYLSPPKGTREGGLVVNTDEQIYFWNSKSEGGDVLDYLQRYHGHDFKSAMQYLADRAGVQLTSSAEDMRRMQVNRARLDAVTVGMRYFQSRLRETAAAREYCAGRGWTEETIEAAGLGYWDGSIDELRQHLMMHNVPLDSKIAKALMKIPRGMLIYGHWAGARCEYVSARAIDRKAHYNPPVDLIGDRQPYYNQLARRRGKYVVVCEGQADAVTLLQWGIPAIALCGVAADEGLIGSLGDYKRVFVALDADGTSDAGTTKIAEALGPETQIVTWSGGKDANDLLQAGGTSETAREILGEADIYAIWLCRQAADADFEKKEELTRHAVETIARLSAYKQAQYKREFSKALGITDRKLREMLKAIQEELDKKKKAEKTNKDIVFSPSGFRDGILYEMIHNVEEKYTKFAVRDEDGNISIQDSIELERVELLPLPASDDFVREQGILLSSGLDDYGDEATLIETIRQFIHAYVDLPDDIEMIASYYVLMTYLADLFPVVPYLRGLGEWGSGKTRFVQVVGMLCFRGMRTVGSSSTSSIFRMIDLFDMITLIMDEADFDKSDATADIINLINTGNRKDFPIWRVEKMGDGRMMPRMYKAFGPKLFSMRMPFKDEATNSRCITWEANGGVPAPRIPVVMPPKAAHEAQLIRNMCLKYRLDIYDPNIEIDYNAGDSRLPGRLREVTIALKTVAPKLAGKIDEFMLRVSKQIMVDWRGRIEAKVIYGILRSYYRPGPEGLMYNGELRLSMQNICDETNRIIDLENARGDSESNDFDSNKQIQARKISWIIRNKLNLRTERGPVGTRPTVLVWDEERIQALAYRYGMEDEYGALQSGKPDVYDRTNVQQKEIPL